MPNWVKNKMFIQGSPAQIDDLLDKCNTDESVFDFNGIVPMPGDVYRGGLGKDEMELYPGDLNWYDWSVNHWGTKWNACEASITSFVDGELAYAIISFDTAWSAPIPIFEAVKEQYPDFYISVRYADEDIGNNCGVWEDGILVGPPNPIEFACDLWGLDPEEIYAEEDI